MLKMLLQIQISLLDILILAILKIQNCLDKIFPSLQEAASHIDQASADQAANRSKLQFVCCWKQV